MSFLDRAKNLYSRGEAVRAAVLLAEGLKRNPSEADALEWLLDLYVRELPTSGIEAELIQILANQPNGRVLYEVVENALETNGAYDKLKALDDSRKRANVLHENDDAPAPGPPVEPAAPVAPTPEAASSGSSGSHASAKPTEPSRRDDWDALDREAMASINGTTQQEAGSAVAPPATTARPEAATDDNAHAAPVAEPPSGLSRVLPPLDDINDDLVGLGIGEDEPEVDPGGAFRYRGAAAIAVAIILLGAAFVAAFIHGSNVSGSDADAPGNDGSATEDMQ